MVLSGSTSTASTVATASTEDVAASVIARNRERIPELMAEQGVPGLAVALVDGDGPLWVEGFGHRDEPGGEPVSADTVFSVQSMSKLFTATAVMRAVAAGRLDLDEPITTYLPGFTVHSAFEEHPEQLITLRMLLAHTAGFTHEAPVGNNNDLDPAEFDDHVRSISDTWLRFPVGTGHAYSNLGIDLAGYILERVEGSPFAEVMRESLLEPLGMDHSTFDRAVIRSAPDRAVGHADPYPAPPIDVPMSAAGGLYTSANDLARFLRFQLGNGSIEGRTVLVPELIEEMRRVPAPRADAPAGYGLGVVRTRWNALPARPDLFFHGGGGYGFLADLWWLPQLSLGVAILTNSQDHRLQQELALSILGDLLATPGPYRDGLRALPTQSVAIEPSWEFQPPPDLGSLVAATAMPARGDEHARWAGWTGSYRASEWGVLPLEGPPDRFVVDAGVPYFEVTDDDGGPLVRHRLVEVAPGVFLADNGETLDLSGPTARWRSLELVRVAGGPAPWQWDVLATSGLLAVGWLVTGALRAVRRRPASRPAPDQHSTAARRWRRVAASTGVVTAVLVLANVALVAWLPEVVDAGFLGWLELSVVERLAAHAPLALAALGTGTVVLVVAGWVRHWWPSRQRLQYAALAVAAAAVIAQLAGWRLIGWGYT